MKFLGLESHEYPYKDNSLNLIRLILALTVLVAHSFYIYGLDPWPTKEGEPTYGPSIHGENLGGWAVAGFFVISGFLITRSRFRAPASRFLVLRVARIYPAFLVCLVVTALVFGPISAFMESGGLQGYWTTASTPVDYVWQNLGLSIRANTIGNTLSGLPLPREWNGSLWTLYYEFICYMLTMFLGFVGIYRRSIIAVVGAWLVSLALWVFSPEVLQFGLDVNILRLIPYFLGGAVAFAVVNRWGMNSLVGVLSLAVAVGCILAIPKWGGQVSSPLLALALMWLGTVIPQPSWISRNDISYGIYIYAWPVQQLIVVGGLTSLGFVTYTAMCTVVAAILAYLSWILVEKQVLARVREQRFDGSLVARSTN